MDWAKLLSEGIEIPPNAAKALAFAGRVCTAVAERAKDGRFTLTEALEVAGKELPGN